jgi:hypothetical protein
MFCVKMPFKKSKNRKKKDAAKEKSDSEDIDFDCEVSYDPKFLPFSFRCEVFEILNLLFGL